jgi:hypothetical protein
MDIWMSNVIIKPIDNGSTF